MDFNEENEDIIYIEDIIYFKLFKTDTFGSWGIGEKKYLINEYSFPQILNEAKKLKALVVVKPTGKYYYIKGFNKKKTFEEIKTHIERNEENKYRENTELYLINYK